MMKVRTRTLSALRRVRAGALRARFGRSLPLEQHERRRDAGSRDRDAAVGPVFSLHIEPADVDDARELADAIEEERQVVISAFEFEVDWPLGVQLLGDRRRRLEALDRQV